MAALIHREPILVDLDPDRFQADPLHAGRPSRDHDHDVCCHFLPIVEGNDRAPVVFFAGLLYLTARPDIDPLFFEDLLDNTPDLRIFAVEEPVGALNEGYAAP